MSKYNLSVLNLVDSVRYSHFSECTSYLNFFYKQSLVASSNGRLEMEVNNFQEDRNKELPLPEQYLETQQFSF